MPNRLPKEQSVNVRVLFADDDLLQRQSKAEIHKETEYGKTDGALRYMAISSSITLAALLLKSSTGTGILQTIYLVAEQCCQQVASKVFVIEQNIAGHLASSSSCRSSPQQGLSFLRVSS